VPIRKASGAHNLHRRKEPEARKKVAGLAEIILAASEEPACLTMVMAVQSLKREFSEQGATVRLFVDRTHDQNGMVEVCLLRDIR